MNSLAVLAMWHCCGWWLASCILMCNAMQLLLKGFVDWLTRSTRDGKVNHDETCLYFFAILLRSWLLVCFYSDMIRYCIWLCRDAWRPDAFEAYRRTLCGLSGPAMRKGALYDPECGWPKRSELSGFTRGLDIGLQIFIYASMDVLPVAVGVGVLLRYGVASGPPGVVQTACTMVAKTLAVVSLLHVVLFWIGWLLTDLAIKVRGFSAARGGLSMGKLWVEMTCQPRLGCCDAELTDEASELDEADLDASDGPGGARPPWAAPGGSEPSTPVRSPTRSPTRSGVSAEEVLEAAHRVEVRVRTWRPPWQGSQSHEEGDLDTADEQNICIGVCEHSRFVMRHVVWIGVFIAGVVVSNPPICLLAAILAIFTVSWYAEEGKMLHFECRPWWWHSATDEVWALQEWGERCCGLDPEVQFERRKTFAYLAVWEAVVFTVLAWYRYTGAFVLLLLTQLRFVLLRDEAPWGWLFGLIEAFGFVLGTTLLSWQYFWPDQPHYFVNTMFMLFANQCGLASKGYNDRAGYRIRRAVTFILFSLLWLVVTLVCYAMYSVTSKLDAEETNLGPFYTICDPFNPNCSYYTVPNARNSSRKGGLPCREWIWVGGNTDKRGGTFSLSDLALFAALAYEDEPRVDQALQHYFPGWRTTFAHCPDELAARDWTNFFDFTSPDNDTTIIAVRGTRNPVDFLTDLVIWMPAFVIGLFADIGPNFIGPAEQAITDLTHVLSMQSFSYEDVYKFEILYRHVVVTREQYPDRQFFIVGHSLGGGLAKIVSERALREGKAIQAVTFMSPGLGSTGYLVLDPFRSDWVMQDPWKSSRWGRHAQTLTVVPDDDIVSRIDKQRGLVVPLDCTAGDALTCHQLFTGICQMLAECGAGRDEDAAPLELPCGKCPGMPCPSGR